jgi:hypothetical protein
VWNAAAATDRRSPCRVWQQHWLQASERCEVVVPRSGLCSIEAINVCLTVHRLLLISMDY